MFDLSRPVEFNLVLLVVLAICVIIGIGIFLVNMRTKKIKEKN